MSLIEEIDSPTPSDNNPDVPGAIWTFVRDLALVSWSYVFQVFWHVWTGLPFETFRNGLVAAWFAWKNFGPSS